MDPYRLLNVDRYAYKQDIDYQYERLRRTSPASEHVLLDDAYATLSDPDRRAEYDREHAVDDRVGVRWADVEPYQARLCLTVNDVLYGCYKDVTVNYRKPCGACEETGIDDPKKNIVRCRECGGRGVDSVLRMPCMGCKGDGMFVLKRVECGVCRGAQYETTSAVRSVYLRPGYAQNEVVHIESGVVGTVCHDPRSDPRVSFRNEHAYVRVEIDVLDVLLGVDTHVRVGDHTHALKLSSMFDFEREVALSSFGPKGVLYAQFVVRPPRDDWKLKLLRSCGSVLRDVVRRRLPRDVGEGDR
jgi:DnaJ-class molecular chaperone